LQNLNHQKGLWDEFRRRRRLLWLVPIGILLLSWGSKNFSSVAPVVLFALAIVAYVVLLSWSERCLCPHCGKRFQAPGSDGEQCSACGVRKWQGLQ
jgi:hypothetical protein